MTNQLTHQKCPDTVMDDTNVPTKDDDKQRHMTDTEILRQKLNLEDSLLDEKGKEEFLTKTDGLTSCSSPVVLVKRKNQNLYRVCSDFRILNEKLLKINRAFPLV